MLSDLDQQSLENAKHFLSSPKADSLEIGTAASLRRIHHVLFDKLYDFAEQIRQQNIAKGNFRFANTLYLPKILAKIDTMPMSTIYES